MSTSVTSKGHRVFAAFYDRLNAGAERAWLGRRRGRTPRVRLPRRVTDAAALDLPGPPGDAHGSSGR